MAKSSSFAARLYRGEVSYNIVGNWRRWYVLSGVIVILALVGLFGRGLNFGIEFSGGAEFQVPSQSCSLEGVRSAALQAGAQDPTVTQLGGTRFRVQTAELTPTVSADVVKALASTCGTSADEVKVQLVGSTWGGEITSKAVSGLLVFLVAVSLFLSIYFEWRMAVAALVALAHDLLITIGIYALVGFEVTPATVIGLLTILGFSLYDTVVVFDKVKENTKGVAAQSRQTYSEAANLAVNQTIVRSINTSIVALLPVAAILFVGAGLLGAGTLKDLALALLIGTAAGTYSSIFVATPFLCQLKERQPVMKALAARVAKRRSNTEQPVVRPAAAGGDGASASPGPTETLTGTGAAVDVPRKQRSHRGASGSGKSRRSRK